MENSSLIYIFVPGGPGANSNPEKNLLETFYKQNNLNFIFWNEPTDLSANDAYRDIVDSLTNFVKKQNKKVVLVGHSFGCQLIIDSLSKFENEVLGTIFLSPALALEKADFKIVDLAISLFKSHSPKSAQELERIKVGLDNSFNQEKKEALSLAFTSGHFALNFIEPENFNEYFSYFSGEFSFRPTDYMKIRESFAKYKSNTFRRADLPNMTIVGENDPIFPIDHVKHSLVESVNDLSIEIIKKSSHYPHIENREEVIELIKRFEEQIGITSKPHYRVNEKSDSFYLNS